MYVGPVTLQVAQPSYGITARFALLIEMSSVYWIYMYRYDFETISTVTTLRFNNRIRFDFRLRRHPILAQFKSAAKCIVAVSVYAGCYASASSIIDLGSRHDNALCSAQSVCPLALVLTSGRSAATLTPAHI